ncbi:hypothetical protein B7494_g7903 [Chlorociboria aeruginascens]|nr:hypothetical protein B7494_g7903 [Chlorociboria aeruginascens]
MPHGPTNFRSTVVKPYYQDPDISKPDSKDFGGDDSTLPDEEIYPINQPAKRGRGRPKGSKNIQRTEAGHVTDLFIALCTTHSEDDDFDEIDLEPPIEAFITRKEQADKALSLELRQKGVITTAGALF